MATYSIYQTKTRRSEVLRLVKTRREVVITERGKPIAKIVPFDKPTKNQSTNESNI